MSVTKYKKSSVLSNSEFYYQEQVRHVPMDHLVPLSHEFEKKLEVPHQMPFSKLKTAAACKEIILEEQLNAFELAELEEQSLQNKQAAKKELFERRSALIQNIVDERERKLKEEEEKEKQELKRTLIVIIKDALRFTKENNPIVSMIPNSLTNAINQLREDQNLKKKGANILNISSGSLNLSFKTTSSAGSVKKYESNQFLKLLGLDLSNLSPENIRIDIDKAYNFIKRWKLVKKEDIGKIIRFKVVNEIMNVEERRSVQKLAKINKKVKAIIEKKKEIEKKEKRKKEDFLVFSQTNYDTAPGSNPNINSQENKTPINTKSKTNDFPTKPINTVTSANNEMKILNTVGSVKVGNRSNSAAKQMNPDLQRMNTQTSKQTTKSKSRGKSKPLSKRHAYQVPLENDEQKKKKKGKILFNAYNNAERIIRYIDNHEALKENEELVRHFQTFKYTKKFDEVTSNLLKSQQLTLCSETDFSNINLMNAETQQY